MPGNCLRLKDTKWKVLKILHDIDIVVFLATTYDIAAMKNIVRQEKFKTIHYKFKDPKWKLLPKLNDMDLDVCLTTTFMIAVKNNAIYQA